MAKQSSKSELTPGYAAFRAELLQPALFSVLSGTQVKLLVYMLKHGERMFPSEATIVKDTGLDRGTVTYTLRGFAHAGLLLKQRRSKGVGLQSSNEYRLGNLTDPRLIEHLVASFGHKQFARTMKALTRGGDCDQVLLEQYRWTDAPSIQAPLEAPQRALVPAEPNAGCAEPVETNAPSSPSDGPEGEGEAGPDWTRWLAESGFKPNAHDTIIGLAREHGYSLDTVRAEFEDIEKDTSANNKQGCLISRLKAGTVTGGLQISGYDPANEQHQSLMANIERWFRHSPVMGRGKCKLIATYFQAMLEPWSFSRSDEFKELTTHELNYVNGREYKVYGWSAMKALADCYEAHMPANADENNGGVIFNVLMQNLGQYIPTVDDERLRVEQQAEEVREKAVAAQAYERELAFEAYRRGLRCVSEENPAGDERNRHFALRDKFMSLAARHQPEMEPNQLDDVFRRFAQRPIELAERMLELMEVHGMQIPQDALKRAYFEVLEPYGGAQDPDVPLKPGESYQAYFHRLHFDKYFKPLEPGQEHVRYDDRDYSYIPAFEPSPQLARVAG